MWDVFISYAWEDRESVAQPLADALKNRGLSVWFDQTTLKLGDHLSDSIDRGLAESRYGIVILSPHFFAKAWPRRELEGFRTRELHSGKIILPVRHGLTAQDVERYSVTLANRISVTTDDGLFAVVDAVVQAINANDVAHEPPADNERARGQDTPEQRRLSETIRFRHKLLKPRTLIFLALMLILVIVLLFYWRGRLPPDKSTAIGRDETRVDNCAFSDTSPPTKLLAHRARAGSLEIEASSDVDGPFSGKYLYTFVIKNRSSSEINLSWKTEDGNTLVVARSIAPNACARSEREGTNLYRIDKNSQITVELSRGDTATAYPVTGLSVYAPINER